MPSDHQELSTPRPLRGFWDPWPSGAQSAGSSAHRSAQTAGADWRPCVTCMCVRQAVRAHA